MATQEDLNGLVRDPEFQAKPWAERHKLLVDNDPGYAASSPSEQAQFMNQLKRQSFWKPGPIAQAPSQPVKNPKRYTKFDQAMSSLFGDNFVDYAKNSPTEGNVLSNLPRSALNTVYNLGNMPVMGYQNLSDSTLKELASNDQWLGTPSALSRKPKGALNTPRPGLSPSAQEELNAQTSNAGKSLIAPFGLAGPEAFNEAWATSPFQSLLSVAAPFQAGRMVKGKMSQPMTEPQLSGAIQKGIEKGIRPGIEGNRTFKQNQGYMSKAENAVKKIVESKDNLALTDEYGEPTGQLPQNLRQFSQAIDQTKGRIFDQYNDMAKQAGEQGATVQLKPLASELNKISNNKVLQDTSPGTIDYAKKRADAYMKRGQYTTKEAQEAIGIMNQSLDAYYKNPSYDTASKAYIDAMIANHMRDALDKSIEGLQGPGYQQLKNDYGSLKTIEKDVNRRAIVDARRNNKGLIDFSDIFSGSEVVRGLMTMNPAVVGQGVAAKVIASLYKMKNDPNRIVKGMFRKVDKNYTPPETPGIPDTTSPEIQGPPHNPNMYGYGKINTIDLPIGAPTFYDRTIGARTPVNNNIGLGRHPAPPEPQLPATFYDKTIGARVPVKNNGSGESSASMEAINKMKSDAQQGIKTYYVDTRSGKTRPAIGPRPEDNPINPYEKLVQEGPKGTVVLNQGKKAM